MHITDQNLDSYLRSRYGVQSLRKKKEIARFRPLLQKNYGGPNDCTLTCITAILNFITNYRNSPKLIYNYVEKIAQDNLYEIDGNGTWPVAIRTIFNQAAKKYTNKTSCVNYGKGVGYNYEEIKKEIDKGHPIILSMFSDGLGYYDNHSVTIVGYNEYDKAKMLKIFDNWTEKPSYIDYNKLSVISSINCLCSKNYPVLDLAWKAAVSLLGKKK